MGARARESGIHFQVVGGWVLPTTDLPWTPQKATALRRTLHHVERCRGILQAHSEAFPAMSRADAQVWRDDLRLHHGEAMPCWWSASVRSVAESVLRLAGGDA